MKKSNRVNDIYTYKYNRDIMNEMISGAEALVRSLMAEGVDTIFGYPGGAIIPVFDRLYDYKDRLRNILVRHEQGAIHAAQGYARVSGRTGVVVVTSGPAATNVITGLSDAMMDSTPLVVITGQVGSELLGSDAFQETDVIGITQPVTKWSYQIRNVEDLRWAVGRAFYIASTGRPGPVVLDFAKNAQTAMMEWRGYKKCRFVRTYEPCPEISEADVDRVAQMIDKAKRPLIIAGHGVEIAGGEQELLRLARKAQVPLATTLLGLSTVDSDEPLFKGFVGMHGNVAANVAIGECDVLVAVGMRFDDRVTGDPVHFATQASVVHIDIDSSEFGKIIKPAATIHGDAKAVLSMLADKVSPARHDEWLSSFEKARKVELEKVIKPELDDCSRITMGSVARKVAEAAGRGAVLVTDVGQNQMLSARYFKYTAPRSIITSGGLGTMGFGLPASIGAKIGAPDRTVCFFTGDGGLQMTEEELGVILHYGIDVKIVLLNNNFLGMVRQWQTLFYDRRFSATELVNPNFVMLANAYGIPAEEVETPDQLDAAIGRMFAHKGAYLLNINIDPEELVYPMTPAGAPCTTILLNKVEKYEH